MNSQSRHRILVLDDEILVALEITDLLEHAGYEVVGPHASLRTAVRQVASDQPDLAVLDVNLGADENSLPLARQLIAQDVPVVFATATDRRELGELDAVVEVVAKPFSSRDLLSAIRRRLRLDWDDSIRSR